MVFRRPPEPSFIFLCFICLNLTKIVLGQADVGNAYPALPTQCTTDEFLCPKPDGTTECVPTSWVCDGSIDCVAAVDEPDTCNNTGKKNSVP